MNFIYSAERYCAAPFSSSQIDSIWAETKKASGYDVLTLIFMVLLIASMDAAGAAIREGVMDGALFLKCIAAPLGFCICVMAYKTRQRVSIEIMDIEWASDLKGEFASDNVPLKGRYHRSPLAQQLMSNIREQGRKAGFV